jgi:hypothetical protein
MLLMAKASIAVLLSFMGEAPLLSFYAGFFDMPVIGLELIHTSQTFAKGRIGEFRQSACVRG